VLDARQGAWRERKRAWLSLGIQSEIGRGTELLKLSEQVKTKYAEPPKHGNEHLTEKARVALGAYQAYGGAAAVESGSYGMTGTSVFDPVLCELIYKWFAPERGLVLDPFAGGSVRGILAAHMGREYTGVDLRT
jgi:hypothetical protein